MTPANSDKSHFEPQKAKHEPMFRFCANKNLPDRMKRTGRLALDSDPNTVLCLIEMWLKYEMVETDSDGTMDFTPPFPPAS